VQAFGHDIKVTPRLFGLLPHFFSEPTELKVNPPKSLIDSLESLVDPPKSRVHGSFELGNRHRLTRSAHHSIVVHATTMPHRKTREDRIFRAPVAFADSCVAISSTPQPPGISNR
jgi:hypothetical protein